MINHAAQLSPFEMAALAANLADAKKASDVLILETGKVSDLADYFVICSGDSTTQIRALIDTIEKEFRERGFTPIGMDRDPSSKWCILDYGDIVIHVMNRKERQFYQLEHFWNHATVVNEDRWLHREAS